MPGIFFAGTISQGAAGLKKHGLPSNSGAVHGARYNAGSWPGGSRRPGSTGQRHGSAGDRGRRARRPGHAELADRARAVPPAGYLARVVSLDPRRGLRDEGLVPLSAFLDAPDGDGGGDALAATLEADGSGAIYPVVYRRRGGRMDEVMLDPIHCCATTCRPCGPG